MQQFYRLVPILIVLFLTLLATGLNAEEQAQDQDQAQDLANAIRRFNAEFGGVVAGEMTPEEISKFERMITPAFEPDLALKMQCAGLAKTSVMAAGLIKTMQNWPSMASEVQATREEFIPGSLHEWLLDFSLPLISSLGSKQTEAAANHECLQKKPVYAMYSDLPMNSPEMAEAENCYVNQVCKD